ncbi:MAG: thioredoxin-like domain-containing protein [Verrucomicrobiota bacterium]
MKKTVIILSFVVLILLNLQLASAQASLLNGLGGSLVSLQGNDLRPYDVAKLAKVDYVAVYFSAHWCPPCRSFTPKLVEYYNQAKPTHPNFEIIFISNDRNAGDMKNYMKETGMKWPAVIYDKARGGTAFSQYAQRGIPNLVFIDKNGKVLSASYDGGRFVGPYKVLDDIQKTLK